MSTYTVLPSEAIRHSGIRHSEESTDDWRAKVDPRLLAFWSLGQRGRTAVPGIVELLSTVLYPAAAQRDQATEALRLPLATVHSADMATCGPISSMAAGISLEGEGTAVFRVSLKVDEDHWTPKQPGMRQRWQHGPHVIADVRQANLEGLARLASVQSIELARPARVTGCCCSSTPSKAHHTGPLNLPAPNATQPDPSSLVGIVDLRFDVLHPDLAWRVGYQAGWPLYEPGTVGRRSKVRAVRDALANQVTDSTVIEDELQAWTAKATAPNAVAAAAFPPYAMLPHKPVATDGTINDHGTICAAVAAGRPHAVRGAGQGVAPDSELLLAALTGESGAPAGSTTATTTDVVESVAWMM
ncbi:MAG: hypothetical protein GXP62_07685, partial [Oligoflexia bacterium]|nr:hypothetical protein [Oligoflexia bacterium]